MRMLKLGATIGLFCLLFCCCCASVRDPGDVAADRGRWMATRDVTADNAVTAQERTALDSLLEKWDRDLTDDEATIARGEDTVQDLIRVYGLAAVQLWVTPELQKRAPELFRLVDRTGNGALEEAELLAVDPRSTVFAAVVVSTAARLIAEARR